jgi:hypothetical protein
VTDVPTDMPTDAAPAFYARQGGSAADWWTLLHPPYTAWHLSYVVIGATLVPPVDWYRLGVSGTVFFLGVGVSAHAFDELNGRPLGTAIPTPVLAGVGAGSLAAAAALGLLVGGAPILPWAAVGTLLVLGYNLEWLGGALHNDAGFAAAWGAFPLLAAAFVQPAGIRPASVLAAGGAFAMSLAQRRLSTPARRLRRNRVRVTGELREADGAVESLDAGVLLRPLEQALRAMTGAVVALAAGLALSRAVRR